MKRAVALVGLVALGLGQAGVSGAEDLGARAATRLGLSVERGHPMTIDAEELEVIREEGTQERVVFRRNVELNQGDLRITCDQLEAFYPEGAGGQPEQILARGRVRMHQAATEVHCTEAVFSNESCRVLCSSSDGLASLRRGDDLVEGREIEFDLCKGLLKVRGARLHIEPEKPAAGTAE